MKSGLFLIYSIYSTSMSTLQQFSLSLPSERTSAYERFHFSILWEKGSVQTMSVLLFSSSSSSSFWNDIINRILPSPSTRWKKKGRVLHEDARLFAIGRSFVRSFLHLRSHEWLRWVRRQNVAELESGPVLAGLDRHVPVDYWRVGQCEGVRIESRMLKSLLTGSLDAVFPLDLLLPSELFELGRVDEVATIVEESVGHERDHLRLLLGEVQRLQQVSRNLLLLFFDQ